MGVSKGNPARLWLKWVIWNPPLLPTPAGDWTPGTLSMEEILDLEQTSPHANLSLLSFLPG